MTQTRTTSKRIEAASEGKVTATPSRGLVAVKNPPRPAVALNMPPLVLNDENKNRMLAALSEVGNLAEACVIAHGHNYGPTYMRAAQFDAPLRRAMDSAQQTFSASVEKKLRDLVFNGSKKYITNKNGIVRDKDGNPLFNVEVDGRLLTLLLRRYDKSFNEQKSQDINLNVNAPDSDRFSITGAELTLLNKTEIDSLMSIYRKVQAHRDGERLDEVRLAEQLTPPKADIEDAEYIVEDGDSSNPFGI